MAADEEPYPRCPRRHARRSSSALSRGQDRVHRCLPAPCRAGRLAEAIMMRRFSSVPIGVVFLGVSLAMSPARGECPSGQLFTQPTPYSSGESPFHVAAADFNGDGILDLAVTDNGGSDIGVLLGVGNGTFHDPVRYPVHSGNGHLITVDLDRDGILDIATNSSGTDVITVLRGRGDGTFE